MKDTDYLQARLAQIQSLHSGKAPFAPLDDLRALYRDLNGEERRLLIGMLEERRHDAFWAYFVSQFLQSVSAS